MDGQKTDPKLRVAVAAHKPYWMPDDPVFRPCWAGAALHADGIPENWARDNEGEGISQKNRNYCELTVLWWAWKNLRADYLGLAHYRRYFASAQTGEKKSRIASGDYLMGQLDKAPVILPKKRNYLIETNYSQYVHAHHEEDLAQTRAILEERYPSYLAAYDASMGRTTGHRFNMFVMRADLFDSYCEWLFDVLGELERRLDISGYSDYDKRVYGFVSERLLDPWIETNYIDYVELPVVNLEDQHWMKKGTSFLKRKFTAEK
ncbi:DUF4422 domain-containing protein [Olsenella sp. DNF00959]|uniref:DUF4422 domain-containing protein n=1 Tax=Olsenella sp. DNF00959 TaxID=1476999 RepID=UPI000783F139|nr:DUF4422 domain-containing protein [Olsenella sp. DNF00959]KXB63944.1 putative capsular biosynthesis protein [Olsenella sp. DNF00959]